MKTTSEPTLEAFVRYNLWANLELLSICEGLDPELLTAPIPGSAGSVLETFRHILQAEASFLKRIHGGSPQPGFGWETEPGPAQMAAYAARLGEAMLDTVRSVSPDENVHEEGGGWEFDYQARLIFMSLAYHGIAHRTDLTTFLNSRGVALHELDVWAYQAAYPERFQANLKKIDHD